MRSSLRTGLAGLLAPPRCAGCREGCSAGVWICSRCRDELARQKPPARTDVAAAFPYSGIARQLIRELKFGGAVALATEMAELMADRCGAQLVCADWIVPVPAHPQRRRVRGYNQSQLLARELAGISGARMVDCLARRGQRQPQSQLDRRSRLEFPAGEIHVRGPRLAGSGKSPSARYPTNVVVCDDVATTGVTLEVCVQAIREDEPEAGRIRFQRLAFAAA